MKKAGKTLIVIAVIAILMVLSGSFYTTMENEYSVVKQFGRIVQTNDTAGLRVKVPFVQTVSYVPKALQVYDLPQSEVITSDKKTMIVDAYVLWDVTDAKAYTQTLNASASTAQGRIDVIVYNAIKTTISSMTQEELIASRDNSVRIETTTDETDDIEIKDIEAQELDEDGNVIKSSDKEVEVPVLQKYGWRFLLQLSCHGLQQRSKQDLIPSRSNQALLTYGYRQALSALFP